MGTPHVCRLIVLGSTGSIGTQTLDVVEHLNALHARDAWPTRYDVVGLAAGKRWDVLSRQIPKFPHADLALVEPPGSLEVPALKYQTHVLHVRTGPDGAEQLVRNVECDLVVAAMSGSAGLPATLAAIELGRNVALANKETLVAAGNLIVAAANRSGAKLLPVDSEHSGIWQCLCRDGRPAAPPMTLGDEVSRIVLTASGGPFRTWTRDQRERATPEQALKHPTWSMGRKVTIDSASLMNKALEIIEAHWLFGLPPERIGVLIHPQSLVHAMVEFADGSMLAQLGAPDMKAPIQHALSWPRHAPGCATKMDWTRASRLEFEPVDASRFPAVDLAYRAIREGSGAVLNAANEIAAEAFLRGRLPFTRIADLVERTMDRVPAPRAASLDDVLATDRLAREVAAGMIGG